MKRPSLVLSFLAAILPIFFLSAQDAPVIMLEGLYATSVALDYNANGPHNLFDGKPTLWTAMPGAAPDEGVMLYLEKPVYISSVEAAFPSGGKYAEIKTMNLYANGQDMGEFPISGKMMVNRECTSLYLRIGEVTDMTESTVQGSTEGTTVIRSHYGSREQDKPVALAEIILFGKNNLPIKVIPPRVVRCDVVPSTTLKPEEAYHAGYLFDSRRDSGWVEGNPGSGNDESLVFTFAENVTIKKIKIWNGMLLSDTHYTANERVKSFKFFSGTDDGAVYSIPDSQTAQVVSLKKNLTGKNFSFVIKDVYAGKKYKDTVISEMSFFDGISWFSVDSGEIEKRKKKILASVKGSVLSPVIDRMYREKTDFDTGFKMTTVILRSDSSFVIWLEDEENDYSTGKTIRKTRVLDGFWTAKSSIGDKAVITLLGRDYNMYEQIQVYQGKSKASSVNIFSDTLTVTSKGMKGTKFFGSINF